MSPRAEERRRDDVAVRLGDPIFGFRDVLLMVSPTRTPQQYYETVERPEPLRLHVWFRDGKPGGGTLASARRGVRPADISAQGLARTATLAAAVQRGCPTTARRPA